MTARRLDAIADDIERGWQGEAAEGGFRLSRTLRGVKQVANLDAGLVTSQEARRLASGRTTSGRFTASRSPSSARPTRRRCTAPSPCSRR